jgi:hypothetical protein
VACQLGSLAYHLERGVRNPFKRLVKRTLWANPGN